jgi:hypothetical protein
VQVDARRVARGADGADHLARFDCVTNRNQTLITATPPPLMRRW